MKYLVLSTLTLLLTVALGLPSHAQRPAEWHDELVDHLAGTWKISGNVMGREAHHTLQAEWELNHQFLRMHEKTAADAPPSESPYEATWFLGYDAISERYVLHLMDVFGARFSETIGSGTRDRDRIRFVFEYPDGPFHTSFVWNAQAGTWVWRMEQKNKEGKWSPFAELTLTRYGS